MNIYRIINSRLHSNTYILYLENGTFAWIIDPGDIEPIIHFLSEKNLHLKGIFVTHSHFDHTYGINELQELLGPVVIYASKKTEEGFCSSRLNGSYYAEIPFVIDCSCVMSISNNDSIKLQENICAVAYETPGHNDDCLTYKIENFLFTGDSLIPGCKVHIRSKKADAKIALESIKWIYNHFSPEVIVCPGHLDSCLLKKIKLKDCLS